MYLCVCAKQNAEVYSSTALPQIDVNQLLPSECGKRLEDFDEDDELMFERVVRSSIAPRGSYPWQVSSSLRSLQSDFSRLIVSLFCMRELRLDVSFYAQSLMIGKRCKTFN